MEPIIVGLTDTTRTTPGRKKRKLPGKSALEFTAAQRDAIAQTLHDDLDIRADDARRAIVDDIAQTGAVRTFGYGSLISVPHTQIDAVTKGALKGWRKGFVCYDPYYCGTPEAPGLALGLDRAKGGRTPGAVLENTFEDSGRNVDDFAQTVIRHIADLAKREAPIEEPVYRFHFLEIEIFEGASVRALSCVANPDSRLYAGEGVDLAQKAEIIAAAHGAVPAGRGQFRRVTNLNYLRRSVHVNLEMGDEPCPQIVEMLAMANAHRRNLPDHIRKDLDALEQSGYHPSVYL